jgi:hypothetical protein
VLWFSSHSAGTWSSPATTQGWVLWFSSHSAGTLSSPATTQGWVLWFSSHSAGTASSQATTQSWVLRLNSHDAGTWSSPATTQGWVLRLNSPAPTETLSSDLERFYACRQVQLLFLLSFAFRFRCFLILNIYLGFGSKVCLIPFGIM